MQQRELTADEFAQLKSQATGIVNISVQEVYGGYIISGSIDWRYNGQTIAVQQDRGVAMDYQDAVIIVDRYLTTKQMEPSLSSTLLDEIFNGKKDMPETVPEPQFDANTYPSEDKDSD